MAGIGATVALIPALAPKADPAVIQQAVEDYLEAHPEISVADGSITEAKLASDVALILSTLESDVSDAKNAIQGMNATEPLANIYVPQDLANVLEGYILKKGVPQTNYGSSYCVTDYIAVTGGDTLNLNFIPWGNADNAYRCAEYNSNKEYIGYITAFPATLNANTAYIRFSVKMTDFGGTAETAMWYLNTNFIISNGEYVQYTAIDDTKNQYQSTDSVRKTGKYFVDASNYEMLILSKMLGANGKDVGIKMKNFIKNTSWQFSSFGTLVNSTPFVSNKSNSYVEFMNTGEDFFGPIVGFADDNGDGDDPNTAHFTGGMHQFNSKNTARILSFDVYYDGRKIPSFVGYCDTIDIIIKQNLQVSNTVKNDGTGREVVQEIIRLHFENGVINVETEFIALEDMYIRTFYFLQGIHKENGMGENGIRYIGSEANRGINSMDSASNSGDLLCRTMRMLSDTRQMDITVDNIDIGRFAHVTDEVFSAYVNTYTGYTKCYFNAIRSSTDPIHLNEGDSCMAKGSIRFGIFE